MKPISGMYWVVIIGSLLYTQYHNQLQVVSYNVSNYKIRWVPGKEGTLMNISDNNINKQNPMKEEIAEKEARNEDNQPIDNIPKKKERNDKKSNKMDKYLEQLSIAMGGGWSSKGDIHDMDEIIEKGNKLKIKSNNPTTWQKLSKKFLNDFFFQNHGTDLLTSSDSPLSTATTDSNNMTKATNDTTTRRIPPSSTLRSNGDIRRLNQSHNIITSDLNLPSSSILDTLSISTMSSTHPTNSTAIYLQYDPTNPTHPPLLPQLLTLLTNYSQLKPYHSQRHLGPTHRPIILSYNFIQNLTSAVSTLPPQSIPPSALLRPATLPNMMKQRGEFEKQNLKLHLCNGVFEAYSASYLTTKAHMLAVASERVNLSWVNCEMASFIHMKESNRFYQKPQSQGIIMQALDVLDFSVIHLSAYERSTHRYRDALWKSRKEMIANWHNIDPVIRAGKALEALNHPSLRRENITYSAEALRTVVIMPFLGGAMGAGHSKLGNRFEYLKTCFWSFYEFIPNIVAAVTRQEDIDWARKESGLPFYDLILVPKLPKSAGLPVSTTQQTKLRLLDGRYDFDYVFFTESDQILISRELSTMYEHLKQYPGHMILPHRLMPYSQRVTDEVHFRHSEQMIENAWMSQSCCLPRQNCVERKTWLNIKDLGVPFINYYGLYVPLGNVNFLDENYRACKLTDYVGLYCP